MSRDDFDDEVQNAKSNNKSKLSHIVLNKAKKVKVCKEYNEETIILFLLFISRSTCYRCFPCDLSLPYKHSFLLFKQCKLFFWKISDFNIFKWSYAIMWCA